MFADIPGLVEGASLGVGLGHTFLAHCLRCRVLVHLLDGAAAGEPLAGGPPGAERGATAIIGAFHAIQTELAAFSPALASKPQVVVLNKLDLPAARRAWPEVVEYFAAAQRAGGVAAGAKLHVVSGVTGEGVQDMVRTVSRSSLGACAWQLACVLTWLLRRCARRWRSCRRRRRPCRCLRRRHALPSPPTPPPSARVIFPTLPSSATARVPHCLPVHSTRPECSRNIRDASGDYFIVNGAALERFVQMTNWEFFESVQRFSFVMKKARVLRPRSACRICTPCACGATLTR